MTETSMFWNTNDVGDGADSGFSASMIAGWMKTIFARGSSGVLKRVGNELAASGTATPLEVDTGAAIVYGLFYENSAALELTVTTPSTGTTGGRVNLQVDWSAQTVRAAIQLNTDGTAAIPALVQTAGSEWSISLATFTITTGGVITLTDVREFCAFANSARLDQIILAGHSVIGKNDSGSGAGEAITASADGNLLVRKSGVVQFSELETDGIADGAVTADKLADDLEVVAAQIADDAVGNSELQNDSVDDTKVGNRVPQFYRRQGSYESFWFSPGVTDYVPTTVRLRGGACSSYISDGQTHVTFYTNIMVHTEMGFLTLVCDDPALTCAIFASNPNEDPGSTNYTWNIKVEVSRAGSSGRADFIINWLLIGPG